MTFGRSLLRNPDGEHQDEADDGSHHQSNHYAGVIGDVRKSSGYGAAHKAAQKLHAVINAERAALGCFRTGTADQAGQHGLEAGEADIEEGPARQDRRKVGRAEIYDAGTEQENCAGQKDEKRNG